MCLYKCVINKGSSNIELPKWLRYKNATMIPKNIDNKCFQYPFTLTQHHGEIKNHPENVSNIKLFLDLYNWIGIEYRTAMNKNNRTLFERNNPKISLIELYINLNLVIAKSGKGKHAIIHKSIK